MMRKATKPTTGSYPNLTKSFTSPSASLSVFQRRLQRRRDAVGRGLGEVKAAAHYGRRVEAGSLVPTSLTLIFLGFDMKEAEWQAGESRCPVDTKLRLYRDTRSS